MNDKKYTYDIDKYTIGVDENGEDGIGLTVAKVENGEIHFLGNCYGENARCLDLLIKENQELKKQLENYKKLGFKHLQDKNNNLETQQKEFIEYLEYESKEIYRDGGLRQNIFKQVLQKYKETIGG